MISLLDVLAFALELLALYTLGRWGWQVGGWPAALAAPLVFAVVWGLLLAPRATFPLGRPPRQVLKLVLFSLVGLAADRLWGHWPAGLITLVAFLTAILAEPT